jgi:hypothetical protein
MRIEPLFIRYANGMADTTSVIKSYISIANDEKSKQIAEKALVNIPDLSMFRKDFRNCIDDLIDNGINNQFINYVNCYMKPSLEEYIEGSNASRIGEKRRVVIKEDDTPWIEAMICYNMSLYIKVYGISDIKHCPNCGNFFSHKGKYAKYCSDICKGNSGK